MQTQIKQINKQGQVSIGKKYAGQKVRVEQYVDGTVILTPVEVISKFELSLIKDRAFHERLKAFDQWESAHEPAATDLVALVKDLEA